MSIAALNVIRDGDTIWLETKPFVKVLADVRDSLAEVSPEEQFKQFGSIDNWLSMFLENLAGALDEVSDMPLEDSEPQP